MKAAPITQVACPQCGKSVPWVESEKFRPFCSERCKLIDFGEWAEGERAIPGETLTLESEGSLTLDQLIDDGGQEQEFD